MQTGNRTGSSFRRYFAYGSILEALSFGLYPDKKHVLREFIQNAFDAINDLKKITGLLDQSPIIIKIAPPSIFICDNGIGMDKDDVEKYRRLGYSEKPKGESVGFRGIGKDSGLSVADKIIVTSTKINVPRKYTVEIDACGMLNEIITERNPPLETLLKNYSSVTHTTEENARHYTFVELRNIRQDAKQLFDIASVKDYVRRNCPVPFDPQFMHSSELKRELEKNVPGFSYVNIDIDNESIYKPYPENYENPSYEIIFENDDDNSPVLAFCWYCSNAEGGQFAEKDKSGLIYKVKNFAIGDRFLTRKTLWHSSPERAFYYFGEIHILDFDVIPSTDRSSFEDNEASRRLYERCNRIAQVLNSKALAESDRRRFEVKLRTAGELLKSKEQLLTERKFSTVLKDDIQYQIRKAVEDLNQRLKRTKGRRKKTKTDGALIKTATRIVTRGNKLLRKITSNDSYYRIVDLLKLNKQAQFIYETVIECLKEEFKNEPSRLEHVIGEIDKLLLKKHKT